MFQHGRDGPGFVPNGYDNGDVWFHGVSQQVSVIDGDGTHHNSNDADMTKYTFYG